MNYFGFILCFLWSFLISLFAIPSVRNLAFKKRLLDEPNNRSMHEFSTPRLGGLAIFAGFLSAITLFGVIDRPIQGMISGSILIFFIGLKDDILPVSPVKKFFIQVLATCILIFISDVRIINFRGLLGVELVSEGISYFFSAIVIIGITNSINLIDGLDGLAGSVIVFITVSFFTLFAILGKCQELMALNLCLAGATFGFLRYNFHRAKIFMGDAGSLTSGYIIAFMSINFIERSDLYFSAPLAIAILFIPIWDTSRVFAIRILEGTSPFVPDKNHIHHVLSRFGMTQKQIICILLLLNLAILIFVWKFQVLGNSWLIGIEFFLGCLLTLVLKLIDK